METNLSLLEQIMRFLLGAAILAYSILYLCCTNLVIGLIIGMFFFSTGGLGYCPICNLFNRTRKKPEFRLKKGKRI